MTCLWGGFVNGWVSDDNIGYRNFFFFFNWSLYQKSLIGQTIVLMRKCLSFEKISNFYKIFFSLFQEKCLVSTKNIVITWKAVLLHKFCYYEKNTHCFKKSTCFLVITSLWETPFSKMSGLMFYHISLITILSLILYCSYIFNNSCCLCSTAMCTEHDWYY